MMKNYLGIIFILFIGFTASVNLVIPGLLEAKVDARTLERLHGAVVVSINSDTAVFKDKKGSNLSFSVDSQTNFRKNKKAINPSIIVPGDKVTVYYSQGNTGTMAAKRITLWNQNKKPTKKNKISGCRIVQLDISTYSMEVKDKNGEIIYLMVTTETECLRGKNTISFTDLKVGDKISIVYKVEDYDDIIATKIKAWKKPAKYPRKRKFKERKPVS